MQMPYPRMPQTKERNQVPAAAARLGLREEARKRMMTMMMLSMTRRGVKTQVFLPTTQHTQGRQGTFRQSPVLLLSVAALRKSGRAQLFWREGGEGAKRRTRGRSEEAIHIRTSLTTPHIYSHRPQRRSEQKQQQQQQHATIMAAATATR